MSNLDLFGDVSTADTGVRSDLDFYETPAWMTRALLRHQPNIAGARVLECCAGRGAITAVLREAGCRVVENDLNPAHGRYFRYDMTRPESWARLAAAEPYDWVVTNLPFNTAIHILKPGIDVPLVGFATILLKSFDEPTGDPTGKRIDPDERGPWLAEHPWSRKICLPRYAFRGKGSPSMASDWFIYLREPDGRPACVIDHYAEVRA